MSVAKCGNNGCVYWPRIHDASQVIDGTSYYVCAACRTLDRGPDVGIPVLSPSVLTPAPKWNGRPARVQFTGDHPMKAEESRWYRYPKFTPNGPRVRRVMSRLSLDLKKPGVRVLLRDVQAAEWVLAEGGSK